MKPIVLILIILASFNASSQKSYRDVLNMTKEIKIIDRLYLDTTNLNKTELDKLTAHKYFRRIYGNTEQLPDNNKYYICGKITTHPDFDILFLYTENKSLDSSRNFNLVLLTIRKDGDTYISMVDVAHDNYYRRDDKLQFRKTRSYLYNDFKIKQETEVSVYNKKYQLEYKINDYGMVVAYPKS